MRASRAGGAERPAAGAGATGVPGVRLDRSLPVLIAFAAVAAGVGAARALTTTFLPVLLHRIDEAPTLIGLVMLVNAAAGFVVPLAVGIWSDRRPGGGRLGRRLPFLLGGTALTVGGLAAVALGHASSYAALAAAGLVVYVGLNALATAHRAMVAEDFSDRDRPPATSAQELAMLTGAMLAVLAGGAAIANGPDWVPFAAVAALLPLVALPTLAVSLRRFVPREPPGRAGADGPRERVGAQLVGALRTPGAREVLVAQVLWVTGYAALPVFFILYAQEVLGIGVGAAAVLPAAFGLLTGGGMVVAGRTRPERVRGRLIAGAALTGGGLVAAAPFGSVALVAPGFAAAAVGVGLVTALGFPYFARFVPAGRSGGFSGAFFSVRAISTTVALPLAGGLIAVTGSYRVLLLQGAAALMALAPLAAAERRPAPARGRARARPARVGAVVPCHAVDGARLAAVLEETLRHVEQVAVVADGMPAATAGVVRALARDQRIELVELSPNRGKGDAVAAGVARLMAGPDPPDAVVTLDADGQHPPDRIPSFVAAAEGYDLVIGDRGADRRAMPRIRRLTNASSTALLGLVLRRRVRDSQCGMRLHRAEALARVPPPPGRYEAETRHLKAALGAGLSVGWVPIPAIYDGAESSYRPVRDTLRILAAILAPARPRAARRRVVAPEREFWGRWTRRLGAFTAATLALGALVPLLAPADERLFLVVNSLGDGPEWLYRAIDPHTRNYIVLCLLALLAASLVRPRRMAGMALAITVAAFFSDVLVQAIYLVYDRPRPETVLAADAVFLTHGRSWAHLASFPSGHLVVTTAIAAAAVAVVPALRAPMWAYVAVIGLSRVLFGAHFPLDVVAGVVFGHQVGVFSAALAQAMGLLPVEPANAGPLPRSAGRLVAGPATARPG